MRCVETLAQPLTLMRRDGKQLTPIDNCDPRSFIERRLSAGRRSGETAMSIPFDTVAVNRKLIHRLGHRMPARIGLSILIVTGSEHIEYDAHFWDVGSF